MSLPHDDMKKLTYLVLVIILGGIILSSIKSCQEGYWGKPSVDTVRVVDTVWQKKDSIIVKKVKVKQVIHDTVELNNYQAHENYDSLKAQYELLAKLYTNKNLYQDSLVIPEIKGLIVIKDTIQKNLIFGRGFLVNYSLPTVKETITITKTNPPKRQLYVGGGAAPFIHQVSIGLMYKSKQDKLYGGFATIDPVTNKVSYGVQMYWKLY